MSHSGSRCSTVGCVKAARIGGKCIMHGGGALNNISKCSAAGYVNSAYPPSDKCKAHHQ